MGKYRYVGRFLPSHCELVTNSESWSKYVPDSCVHRLITTKLYYIVNNLADKSILTHCDDPLNDVSDGKAEESGQTKIAAKAQMLHVLNA